MHRRPGRVSRRRCALDPAPPRVSQHDASTDVSSAIMNVGTSAPAQEGSRDVGLAQVPVRSSRRSSGPRRRFAWSAQAASITSEDLLNAQDNAAEWLMYGRDYRNQRFSPLDQITPDNVKELRPVWAFSTGGALAGLEATPLIRDGVLYFSDRLLPRVRARRPHRHRHCGSSSRNTRRGSKRCSAAARSTAAWPSRTIWCSSTPSMPASTRSTARTAAVAWEQTIDDWKKAGDRDRRAAGGRRQGDRRHRRRRVRRARLPQGL